MCPRCREPMVAFELEGVEIDRCLSCGGTWLDAGELEWIAEQAGVDPGPMSRALGAAAGKGQRSNLKCPRCRHRMKRVMVERAVQAEQRAPGERRAPTEQPGPVQQPMTVDQRPAVELDRCRYEHGLWFDEGEMQQVITSFADGEEGAVARFFAELYRHNLRSEGKGD